MTLRGVALMGTDRGVRITMKRAAWHLLGQNPPGGGHAHAFQPAPPPPKHTEAAGMRAGAAPRYSPFAGIQVQIAGR